MTVGRAALVGLAGAMAALVGIPQRTLAQSVQACTGNCAQVMVTGGSGSAGGMMTAQLSFAQGASGGPSQIAALALTLSMTPDGVATPLTLADCTLNADGLPGAVHPDPSISDFRVVVENASCANSTHCLCNPGTGQTLDNFINIVVYGPNPLPTPGPNPIDIPILPTGPGLLMTIDLNIAATASGTIPLHIYNQVQDASPPPQYHALLSVGDKTAVDQTCVPVSGSPPCSTGGAQSQVAFTDGSVSVSGGSGLLVCDVVPFTGDDAGQFGGSGIKNNDVVAIFNASLGNGGPATGTARYNAMDSVTVDNPPMCGGDGNLKNNDVVACFNRSLGNGNNYSRAPSGSNCTSTLVPQ